MILFDLVFYLIYSDLRSPCLSYKFPSTTCYTISESLSDILQRSQTPVEALWSLRSIDLRVITLHPSFVKLRMPQNTSLVLLISEPIRVNVFSFVVYERGSSQYPEQVFACFFGHVNKKVFQRPQFLRDVFGYFILFFFESDLRSHRQSYEHCHRINSKPSKYLLYVKVLLLT